MVLFKSTKKPIFTVPDDIAIGVLYKEAKVGKVFLYIGEVNIDGQTCRALAIQNMSEANFFDAINEPSIQYIEVDFPGIYTGGQKLRYPIYAIYDPTSLEMLLHHLEQSKSFNFTKPFQNLLNFSSESIKQAKITY